MCEREADTACLGSRSRAPRVTSGARHAHLPPAKQTAWGVPSHYCCCCRRVARYPSASAWQPAPLQAGVRRRRDAADGRVGRRVPAGVARRRGRRRARRRLAAGRADAARARGAAPGGPARGPALHRGLREPAGELLHAGAAWGRVRARRLRCPARAPRLRSSTAPCQPNGRVIG